MVYFAILSASGWPGRERRVSEAAGQGPVGLDAPLFIGLLSIYRDFPINGFNLVYFPPCGPGRGRRINETAYQKAGSGQPSRYL